MITVRLLWAAFRLRRLAMPELIADLDRPPRRSRAVRPPVTPVMVVLRLLAGFSPPMRENAAIAAALHRCGVPAQLVVGADPVPEPHGQYRLYTWIEIAGIPLDTDSPPGNYLIELVRFPNSGKGDK